MALRPRNSVESWRCAQCHGELLGEEFFQCERCQSTVHLDCWSSARSCPTLACGGHPRPRLRAARLSLLQQWSLLPQIREERRARSTELQRLLSYLGVGIDGIINDPSERQRLLRIYKAWRYSERLNAKQEREACDAGRAWIQANL